MSRGPLVALTLASCCIVGLVSLSAAEGKNPRPAAASPGAGGKRAAAAAAHTDWIARSLREMQSVQPRMSRADLLTVFREEGGLSTRTQQRYV
ncbi:MAG TPA: hypothetical protein VFU47_13260, partial [Armatimonadota bacterium]|nr:hypothetical protein [Armatimonadota bacterium]